MSSSKSSSKKPAAKPVVKVPKVATKEDSKAKKKEEPAKAEKAKKPKVVVPAPKASAAPAPKAKPVVEAKVKAPAKTPTPKAKTDVKETKESKSKVAPKETKEVKEKPVAEAKPAGKAGDTSKRRIDTPEIQEKIRELIKLAKEQDYLTYDDINEILPNDLVDPDDVEAIMERLRNMEFDIIDASEVDRYKDKKRDEGDGDEEDAKADQKLDILDDPVRMYLKQMGQVPLLTREQEVEISKRIEDAEIEVAKHLHLFGFTDRVPTSNSPTS